NRKYPSRFFWLDINDHGGGYYGIAQDDRSNARISLPDLASAIAAGSDRPVDLLSFDACLMASTEVAYEMRNVAKVMVASEDESYAVGMNYDQTLEAMSNQPTMNAATLGRDLVARVNPQAIFTVSAVDLTKADALAHAVDGLAGALLAAMPTQRASILKALNAVKPFYVAGPNPASFNHRDLDEVVDQLRANVSNPLVQAACVRVKTALFNHGAIIVAHNVAAEQGAARGLSIYLPLDGQIDPIYMNTAFAKATRWPAFLQALKP
ncbi:MAG TPA: clostripain-related cysteine peptidase, partial [Oscillatoriaceae cyanobacterium]